MSQVGGNNIGEATVRITADTSGLDQGLKDAEQKVQQTNLAPDIAGFAAAGAAMAATAVAAFQMGREIEAAAEKFLGFKDSAADVFKAIDDASKTPVQQAKERVAELHHDLLDESVASNAKRLWTRVWGYVNGVNLEDAIDQSKIKGIENAQARLAAAAATAQKDDLNKRIAQEEAATLEGAERIERKRQEAIRKAKIDFRGADTSGLEDAINKRYDEDLRRFQELEAKKKAADEESAQRHMDEIEARKRAYNDLIQHQKMKDREAAAALAEAMSKALSGAFSEMTRSFELNKLVTTMSALNANMEKLTRQRSAQG